MTVEPERINCCPKWLYDYLVGRGESFTVRKRSAVVDHCHVKTQHRAKCRKRLCDMTGSRDNKPLSTNDWIDKNPGRSVRFYMRHRFQAAVGADLEKTRSRVGRALDNLLDSGRLKSRVARILMFRIDHCLDAHRHIALRTRINHRQESGGTVAAGRLGERACRLDGTVGRPEGDKNNHYTAPAGQPPVIGSARYG